MALMVNKFQPSKVLPLCKALSMTLVRMKHGHWFPNYIPKPYPKTEEERLEAAKRYNLLPEEYEPIPLDGINAGDYPNIPLIGANSKDPYYNWDNYVIRRNYMDPIPIQGVMVLPDLRDTDRKANEIFKFWCKYCFAPLTIMFLVLIYGDNFFSLPSFEHQLIKPGVKHYSFELKDSKGHGHH